MSMLVDFHVLAPAAVERMIYALVEGTLLALTVWLLLRLLPRRNSGTRFIVWFSTLLAIAVLPFLHGLGRTTGLVSSPARSSSSHGLFTIPASWAVYAFSVWVSIAFAGLARVAAGLWHVHKLRKSCLPVDPEILGPEIQEIVARFHESRPVLVCVSSKLDVPTAVGFLNPAILLPAWLLEEISTTELKHVLLHELAHLRRRDDWTNLAQKIVKAVLFFHPLVWWIERRLSLDREVACDDAVLVQTASPRVYARCLTRVAEKSFLRRQIALAQAAVSRISQLSSRVAHILDLERPRTIKLWKPAIPLVVVFALLCAFSAQQTPLLVSFSADAPATTTATVRAGVIENNPGPSMANRLGARVVDAGLKSSVGQANLAPAQPANRYSNTGGHVPQKTRPARMLRAGYSDYWVAREEFVVTMTSQGQDEWQVQVWQVRFLVASNAASSHSEKVNPRKI
jgi:beta-lactamase regulating signal transducer with metallopeptidase domain